MRLRLTAFAALAVPLILAVAVPPVALADDTQDEFIEDIARWNELGGQIPGTPSDWLKAANTVCEGTAELQAGGVSPLDAIDAQVRAAVGGGWFKRDGVYFVLHAINSFCPELRPSG
jgi:hypothetical protein